MTNQKNCIFCKIIQEEIPAVSVIKTNNIWSFLDINPINKGHLLIVPTIHAETVFDLPDTFGIQLLQQIKTIGTALMTAVKADGLNVFQNNYPAAGQEVLHVHWHLIPRFINDKCTPWKRSAYTNNQEMNTIANEIISVLYKNHS